MPFTPAHAVVALPFLRTPLVPAAIAIGAMTPDAPLFFRVGVQYAWTHSWWGVITLDLVIGFSLLVVWRLLLRPAVPELSPRWFRERWPHDWSGPVLDGWWSLWSGRRGRGFQRLADAGLIALSLVIGSATHVFWDLFTHEDRLGSRVIPALGEYWGPLPATTWLQHGSSLAGLTIIAIWGFRWLSRRVPRAVPTVTPPWFRVVAWAAIPACLLAGGLFVLLQGRAMLFGAVSLLFRSGTAGGAAILIVAAAVSVIVIVLKARHARDSRSFAGNQDHT